VRDIVKFKESFERRKEKIGWVANPHLGQQHKLTSNFLSTKFVIFFKKKGEKKGNYFEKI
jgi:hypothetical protein